MRGELFIMSYSEYKALTPNCNADNVNEYIKALEWALKDDKIKNIAISGPYGSGKSSFIETFLSQKDKAFNDKVIKISMATFVETHSSNCQSSTYPQQSSEKTKVMISESDVEEGILKQLFYTTDPKRIPNSRYRKIQNRESEDTILEVLSFFVIAFLFSFLFGYKYFNDIYSGAFAIYEYFTCKPVAFFIILFIVGVLVYGVSHFIDVYFKNTHLKEIKLPTGIEIKSESESSSSVFNKNLDEIIYFFEETGYRIIFFEDLDRLDNNAIFVHLRELNYLLNNSETIHSKIGDPIVFIYAVKDDIFEREERTKFFDFIIPIIPIINSTNSNEELLRLFNEAKDNGVDHNISNDFIEDVSPYISDMRVLHQSYNEFIIYKNILRKEQDLRLNDENMLAIILYKNTNPVDFAALQKEQGLVKEAFDSKINIISLSKKDIEEKIEIIKKEIELSNNEKLHTIREIKSAMLVELTNGEGISYYLWFDENCATLNSQQILTDDFDILKLNRKDFRYGRMFSFTNNRSEDFYTKSYNQIIENFCTRIKLLNDKVNNGNERLLKDLNILKQSEQNLDSLSFKELCEKYDVDNKIPTRIRDNGFLFFLLRRGYIEEKYANYINYFKGNSITVNDMNFILSVKNRNKTKVNYSIDNPKSVIDKLQKYEFMTQYVFNYSIVDGLLANINEAQCKEKLEVLCITLSYETDSNWAFIDSYIDVCVDKNLFIASLSMKWPGIWKSIYSKTTISYQRKITYLALLLKALPADEYRIYNIDNSLKEFFEQNDNILEQLQNLTGITILKNIIQDLDIKFINLCISELDHSLIDFVFDNNHYMLNHSMVEKIIDYRGAMLSYDLYRSPYSAVLELDDKNLLDYIYKNIETFINVFILDSGFILEDEENHVLSLLARIAKYNDLILQIMKRESFVVTDLSLFTNESIEENRGLLEFIWDYLIDNNRMIPSWNNIVTYWSKFGLKDNLKAFIANNASNLINRNENCNNEEFISALILSGIDTYVIEKLLPIMKMDNFSIDMKKVPNDILKIMIEQHCFEFNKDYHSSILKIDEVLAYEFLVQNQDAYISKMSDIQITVQEYEKLLGDSRISQENKKRIYFEDGDCTITPVVIKEVLDNGFDLSNDFFENAWQEDIDISIRKELFLKGYALLSDEDIEDFLAELGDDYSSIVKTGSEHDTELDATEYNMKLISCLYDRKYIVEYHVDQSRVPNIIVVKL